MHIYVPLRGIYEQAPTNQKKRAVHTHTLMRHLFVTDYNFIRTVLMGSPHIHLYIFSCLVVRAKRRQARCLSFAAWPRLAVRVRFWSDDEPTLRWLMGFHFLRAVCAHVLCVRRVRALAARVGANKSLVSGARREYHRTTHARHMIVRRACRGKNCKMSCSLNVRACAHYKFNTLSCVSSIFGLNLHHMIYTLPIDWLWTSDRVPLVNYDIMAIYVFKFNQTTHFSRAVMWWSRSAI